MTCTSTKKTCVTRGKPTACLGDSGGPLFISSKVAERYLLIGISRQKYKVRASPTCNPVVSTGMMFTNVASYQEWIEKERLCN